ncbi:MAG: YraN family protein [Clostridiaceae bacterium]|nr:YraN family protein [Clostridiaceae bacterium]
MMTEVLNMNNRHLGSIGEKIASRYLEENGYRILARNFRAGKIGEIDIIGWDGDFLCFIEVKSRTNNRFGTPAEAVSPAKQATIRRIAQIYMQKYGFSENPVRFDVVELNMTKDYEPKNIQILKNAF